MSDIEAGNYIRVQIDNIRSTGTIEGVFLFKTVESFNVRDAFETLIMNYADDKVYEIASQVKEEEEQQQEVMMDYEYVAELINIIDRMASSTSPRCKATPMPSTGGRMHAYSAA